MFMMSIILIASTVIQCCKRKEVRASFLRHFLKSNIIHKVKAQNGCDNFS